jgi:hypothetical protein
MSSQSLNSCGLAEKEKTYFYQAGPNFSTNKCNESCKKERRDPWKRQSKKIAVEKT